MPPSSRSWQAVHILAAAGCNCSRRVSDHLLLRGPLSGVQETVILIGHNENLENRFNKAGLKVNEVSAEEASNRYGLHGVPWLIFLDPGGKVSYAGGYYPETMGRSQSQDVAIWDALRTGAPVKSYPAFGCAVGQRLQRRIDPLGLK